jgi:hypothetical protein
MMFGVNKKYCGKHFYGSQQMKQAVWDKLLCRRIFQNSHGIPLHWRDVEIVYFFNEKKRVCCENVNAPYNEDETS